MLDLLIENARLYPGNPNSRLTGRIGHVGVKGDLIVSVDIGPSAATARTTIDAGEAAVCPGFIDIHSHSDIYPLADGRVESKLRQGVTTEVIGNCGYSAAPYRGEVADELRREAAKFGIEPDWNSVAGYLERLEGAGIAVNYCFLVGHGTLRASVMGYRDRQPEADELRKMSTELEKALEEGAFGISTGLVYSPGIFAETDEIAALARVAAAVGRLYASHIRGEGGTLLAALREAVKIASVASAAVQVSHLKASGRPNWPELDKGVEILETARKQGLDITADRYPYEAGYTELGALFPAWARAGGVEETLQRLKSRDDRRKLVTALEGIDEFGPEDIVISDVAAPEDKDYIGESLAAIAERMSRSTGEAACELYYASRGDVSIIMFTMEEGQAMRVLGLPWVMVGSDASARAGSGPLYQGQSHPRGFGTFPRVLRLFTGPGASLSLAEALYKMTLMPAERLGLSRRGRMAADCFADLVLFDPAEIADTATYDDPHRFPRGIQQVMVNGRPMLSGEGLTSERAGRVLRPE
ncbi:amidohydrolase family protein [candidate division KSB1 bacterium]